MSAQDLRRIRKYDIFKAVVAGVLLLLTLALTTIRNRSTLAAAEPPPVAPPTTIGDSDVTLEGCVTVTGSAPANSTIRLQADGTTLGTTTAAADGSWTYTHCMSAGQYRLVAVTVDSAGTEINRSTTFAVLAVPTPVPTESAPPPRDEPTITPTAAPSAGDGQEYVVQQGDWLMGLSRQFYGTADRWVDIYEASNAKAAEDSSFNAIEDPNVLDPGWKIWIPQP